MFKCNLFLWSKLYFQHHYSSLQCHMIFRNHSNTLICCSRNISDYYECHSISGLRSAPTKLCKTFFKRKRWCVEHSVLMTQELQLRQPRRPFFVLFEEFSQPVEIGINTCLILQNTIDVTVTALAVQNKREHHNPVKGFVETVVPDYCDPTFASHFRMKRQTFQVKDNTLLTSEIWSIWPFYFYCEY